MPQQLHEQVWLNRTTDLLPKPQAIMLLIESLIMWHAILTVGESRFDWPGSTRALLASVGINDADQIRVVQNRLQWVQVMLRTGRGWYIPWHFYQCFGDSE